MAPKLILADLDGTLLDEKKHLTPRSRAALERSAASGAQVVIATGRFFGGVPDFLKELPFLRYFILMNGAKVYDRETDTVLYRAEIPLDTACWRVWAAPWTATRTTRASCPESSWTTWSTISPTRWCA